MAQEIITRSALHDISDDIHLMLASHPNVIEKWNSLTDIARNEWICWVTIVKRQKTREEHISRMQEDLLKGKKRPCCWPGCPHRNPKAVKYFT